MKKNLKQLVMVLILAIMIFPASVRAEGNNCFGDDLKGADQEAFSTLIDEIQCIKEAHPEFNDERILEIIDQNHTKFERGISDIWNSLTDSEKKLCIRYPFAALKVNTAKNIATSKTESKFGMNGLGDRSDAFRHGIWNAEMTILIGKEKMIDKIFKIDISFFEGHASGDIQNRFNSVSEIYQFISITLISAIINAVTAIMCALVMMLQSFYLFQILFIIAAAQILIVYFLNKRARIKIKNYIADQSELQGKMVEILTNIQQIRCMRIDTILCKNIKGDYQHLIQRLKEKAQISDFIETIATTFTTISPMLLYTMGGFLIINSNLELGALVSFITLSTYFTGPFQTLSLIIPQISVLRETMLRINELMNYSDEIQSGKQSIGRFESISLKNVTFKYLGSNEPDLKGINITIKRGEKIAIVGESGSGKTTISKLLLNALTKYEGEILLNL